MSINIPIILLTGYAHTFEPLWSSSALDPTKYQPCSHQLPMVVRDHDHILLFAVVVTFITIINIRDAFVTPCKCLLLCRLESRVVSELASVSPSYMRRYPFSSKMGQLPVRAESIVLNALIVYSSSVLLIGKSLLSRPSDKLRSNMDLLWWRPSSFLNCLMLSIPCIRVPNRHPTIGLCARLWFATTVLGQGAIDAGEGPSKDGNFTDRIHESFRGWRYGVGSLWEWLVIGQCVLVRRPMLALLFVSGGGHDGLVGPWRGEQPVLVGRL